MVIVEGVEFEALVEANAELSNLFKIWMRMRMRLKKGKLKGEMSKIVRIKVDKGTLQLYEHEQEKLKFEDFNGNRTVSRSTLSTYQLLRVRRAKVK